MNMISWYTCHVIDMDAKDGCPIISSYRIVSQYQIDGMSGCDVSLCYGHDTSHSQSDNDDYLLIIDWLDRYQLRDILEWWYDKWNRNEMKE